MILARKSIQALAAAATALLLACATSQLSEAAEPVVVRTALANATDNAVVGQRLRLQLDVLASEGWANLPSVPPVKVANAIVYSPSTQGVRLSESIEGDSYTGQRYELWVFPQRPGKLTVPGLAIDVNVRQFGADAKAETKREQTQPIVLQVAAPPGAPADSEYVCTDQLQVSQRWSLDGEKVEVRVGEGVERTITREISNAPALLMPPVQFPTVDGMRLYPKQPQLSDQSNRGELNGRRVDSTTYVFERAGSFNMPALTFAWWNPATEEWKTEEAPGIEIDVVAVATQPEPVSDATPLPEKANPSNGWKLWAAAAAIVIFVGGIFARRTAIRERWDAIWTRVRHSEWYQFGQVAKAFRSNRAPDALNSLMRWLDATQRETPATLERFLSRYADQQARQLADELVNAVCAGKDDWRGGPLLAAIRSARGQWRAGKASAEQRDSALPLLNPQLRVKARGEMQTPKTGNEWSPS